MEDMFDVYNLLNNTRSLVDFNTLVKNYPDIELNVFNSNSISVINIYENGEKIAVVSRNRRR